MERHPIVFRCPIIQRVPIIQRIPIFHRTPCCLGVEWKKCNLCSQFEDCIGNTFVSGESMESSEKIRLIQVPVDFEDWESLEQQIWSLNNQDVILRLVTDKKLPKEIVWAVSYSEKNIIQININMMNFKDEIVWLDKLMSIANRCGVYCILCLHPIVPGIVRTYHVISLIDRIMRKGCFHINLKFCEIPGKITGNNSWLNFNGHLLSTRYMRRTQDGWKCSPEYIQLFLEKVQLFTIPRRLSVSVCSEHTDCTGLNKN